MKIQDKININGLLSIIEDASVSITSEIPVSIRQYIKILVYIILLVFFLILLPILLPIAFINRNKEDTYEKLFEELNIVWRTESSLKALEQLNVKYRILYEHIDDLAKMKAVKIVPYGRFWWADYIRVTETLYLWEMQHKQYQKAANICDDILNRYVSANTEINDFVEKWIVYKAKTICYMNSSLEAQRYLMEYITPDRENSPIRDYLSKLRKT